MTTMTDTSYTTLEQSAAQLLSNYKQNRRQKENKWEADQAAFRRSADDLGKLFKKDEGKDWRCNAYLGTARQKVIQAAAILYDVLLQNGRINYDLALPPKIREHLETTGQPESTFDQQIENMKAEIDTYYEWAHADRHMMRNILAGVLYGETYARLRMDTHVRKGWQQIEMEEGAPEDTQRWIPYSTETEYLAWEYVSTWNVFTDMEDDDLQTNMGTFVRWFTNKASLADTIATLKGDKFTDHKALRNIFSVASNQAATSLDDDAKSLPANKKELTNLYKRETMYDFIGSVSRGELLSHLRARDMATPELIAAFGLEDLDAMDGVDLSSPESQQRVDVVMTVSGDDCRSFRIVPLDDLIGRPIYRAVCEDGIDDVAPVSVMDNCLETQSLVNGLYRTLIDNLKLSGNVVLGVKEEFLLEPLTEITPGKQIRVDPTCEDVRQAVQGVNIPDVSAGLLEGLTLTLRLLEDDSAIPRIQQGQEPVRGETAFSLAQRLEKSGKYFAAIVSNFDEGLTEPITQAQYDWIMATPGNLEMKGDFEVIPMGFTSFQEKVSRQQAILQFLNVSLAHPEIYETLKLGNIFRELAKMLDLDPDQLAYSQEELEVRREQEMQLQQQAAAKDAEQKDAAIARDRSLATLNSVTAGTKQEETRLKQLDAAASALLAEEE